jgi:Pumilio-family RNA binding repeat
MLRLSAGALLIRAASHPSAVRALAALRYNGDLLPEVSSHSSRPTLACGLSPPQAYSLRRHLHRSVCRHSLINANSNSVRQSDEEGVASEFLGKLHQGSGVPFLEHHLRGEDDARKRELIEEIERLSPLLVCDSRGSFVVQELLALTEQNTVDKVCLGVRGKLCELSMDKAASHVIQKCLQGCSMETGQWMLDELMSGETLSTLMVHPIGNYAISSALVCDAPNLSRLIAVVACHPTGSRLLRRCLDKASGPLRQRPVGAIARTSPRLCRDQHGAFAVLRILDPADPRTVAEVCLRLRGSVRALSTAKFGSQVVQRCLEVCGTEARQLLIDELIGGGGGGANRRRRDGDGDHTNDLVALSRDPHASFVLHCVIDPEDRATIAKLCAGLRGRLYSVCTERFGAQLVRRCLEISDEGTRAWMVDELMGGDTPSKLSQNRYGVRVLRKMLRFCPPTQQALLRRLRRSGLEATRGSDRGGGQRGGARGGGGGRGVGGGRGRAAGGGRVALRYGQRGPRRGDRRGEQYGRQAC